MTDYNFNVVVKDTSGTAVVDATVIVYKSDGSVSGTGITIAGGVLASALVLSDSNNVHSVSISKTGYSAVTQHLYIADNELSYYIIVDAYNTDYALPEDVKSFMGLRKNFQGSDTTRTTDSDVAKRINKAEEFIDNYCGQAWRSVQVTDYYDTYYTDLDFNGLEEVPLRKPNIFTLNSTSGDALDVWSGSSYEDYLTDRTEGLASDYWLDYERGILYIRANIKGKRVIKITYRYGNKAVPADIRDACILLVMHDLITTDQFSASIPEGYNTIDFYNQANIYKSQAMTLLNNHRNLFTY